MSEIAIAAKGLARSFGSHRALDGVDLEIDQGESFGLLGANGAGKTTLLRLLTGLLVPTAGELEVLGRSPAREPEWVRRRLGYVPEEPALYREMSVGALLGFYAAARGLRGAERKAAVEVQLERFDLGGYAKRLCGALSRGLRRRAALAVGFLGDPELVLLDEPTAGLDPEHRDAVHGWLREASQELTLVLCSHDLDEVARLTRRCARMDAGHIVASGETGEILPRPQGERP